jgi:hypothetical protein
VWRTFPEMVMSPSQDPPLAMIGALMYGKARGVMRSNNWCVKGSILPARGLMYSGCGEGRMITPNTFARRHNAGSTENSICLKCFLTVSALEGGPNLREMETRHKCDPMNLFYSRETPTGTASTRKEVEYYLSAPDTNGGEQEEIIRRMRSTIAKKGLVVGGRTGSSFWDKGG